MTKQIKLKKEKDYQVSEDNDTNIQLKGRGQCVRNSRREN